MSEIAQDNSFDKNGLYIIIDKRERAIIPHFKDLTSMQIPFFVEHITTGDIAICYKSRILISIERKTWVDLGASMKDGRKGNIEKLKMLRESTKCKIAYIIEGNPCPKSTTKFSRISHKSLRAHLDHLTFRDDVHMLYATTGFNTALRIFELAKNIGTIKPSVLDDVDEIKGGDSELKIKHTSSDELILFNIWCSFPYITDKTANLFISKFKLRDLICGLISPQDIAIMRYDSGTLIGLKRSNNIIESAKLEKTHINALAAIPSITTQSAKKILDNFDNGILDLFDITQIIKISTIQKSEKMKIGKSAAEKIVKFLSM